MILIHRSPLRMVVTLTQAGRHAEFRILRMRGWVDGTMALISTCDLAIDFISENETLDT
jgi:hypothetical protein